VSDGRGQLGTPLSADVFELQRDPESLVGPDSLARIFGIRTGNVIDIADPEDRGRVRVRVHSIHDPELMNTLIPWADVVTAFGGDPDIDHGEVVRFSLDASVMVMFVNGERSSPVVIGAWRPRNLVLSEFAPDVDHIPFRQGSKTKGGHLDRIIEEPLQVEREILTPGGTSIRIIDKPDASAGVIIRTNGGLEIKLDETTSKITVTSTEVTIDSNSIKLGNDALIALAGVVTGENIDTFTGTPFPDKSKTVFAQNLP
jgi:Type VI secretion system/phage-baseplate injector OB domain